MTKGVKLLKQAAETVTARGQIYGPMHGNMDNIAKLWSVLLQTEVSAAQAASCMIAVKLARLIHTPNHADTVVDIAGYAAVLRECQEEEGGEGEEKE